MAGCSVGHPVVFVSRIRCSDFDLFDLFGSVVGRVGKAEDGCYSGPLKQLQTPNPG